MLMLLQKLWNDEFFDIIEGEKEKVEQKLSEKLQYDEIIGVDKETLTAIAHQMKPITWVDKLLGIKRFVTFHISLKKNELGKPLYDKHFKLCTSFEEEVAAVKDNEGWFHINKQGDKIYRQKFEGAGDFKDGKAPVMKEIEGNREFFLINKEGNRITDKYSTFRNMLRWEAPGGLENPIWGLSLEGSIFPFNEQRRV